MNVSDQVMSSCGPEQEDWTNEFLLRQIPKQVIISSKVSAAGPKKVSRPKPEMIIRIRNPGFSYGSKKATV